MKRKVLVAVCSLSLLLAVGACKKKQEQPAPQTGMPAQQLPAGHPPMGEQGGAPGGVVMPKGETTVSVPDSVKEAEQAGRMRRKMIPNPAVTFGRILPARRG